MKDDHKLMGHVGMKPPTKEVKALSRVHARDRQMVDNAKTPRQELKEAEHFNLLHAKEHLRAYQKDRKLLRAPRRG